jgi:hypothetical protein
LRFGERLGFSTETVLKHTRRDAMRLAVELAAVVSR